MAYTLRGEFDRARADLETFGALTNTHYYTLVGLGIVAALEGNRTEACRIVDAIMDRSTREWVSPMAFGMIEQQLGNYDAALDWYERAYVARHFLLTALPRRSSVPDCAAWADAAHHRATALEGSRRTNRHRSLMPTPPGRTSTRTEKHRRARRSPQATARLHKALDVKVRTGEGLPLESASRRV